MELAVVCKNVTKVFGEGSTRVDALRGVDLEIPQGQFLIMMGPSGSGKTTLISIIAGILMQTEGQSLVCNLDLNHMPDQEKTLYRGKHIGFVFQAFNLIPMLTCEENVAIPLLLEGVERKTAQEQARKLLTNFGIGEKADISPTDLSGGQQQRVAIARALIHNPDLIVCDEPTSFLDHESGMKVMELLRSIVTDQKKTLIVVSHDPRITKFADRIVKLEDGRIVGSSIGHDEKTTAHDH
jgi:putative ABC transport system ATP-binding protein